MALINPNPNLQSGHFLLDGGSSLEGLVYIKKYI